MTFIQSEVRPGAYYDSVVLMQLQRALADLPGVLDAGVVMATTANLDLLASSDLLPPEAAEAAADDLLLVVKAQDAEAAEAALAQVDTLLQQRRSRASQDFRPRSLASAAKMLPEAAWVLLSVPGRYAAAVARDALAQEKHVFLYSDNVSLDDEVALKQTALDKGLLLMGPDCGTAIVNGVGFGFANRLRRGSIGVVAASGTGLQAISARVHALGGGISQAIGTGGRDLSPEVGGITAMQALDLLGRDPQTDVIVLVSKPPAPEVVSDLMSFMQRLDKPIVVYFMGYATTLTEVAGRVYLAHNLDDTAAKAMGLAQQWQPAYATAIPEVERAGARYVRGLFSGGTLAYEVLLGLQATVSPLYSNVPVYPEQRLADPLQSEAHTILDLGADQFTQGRLHPMMDNALRLRRLRREAADPEVGILLLDVVLGEGAHPDPAAELAPAIAEVIEEHAVAVLVLLVGTDADPQGLERQRERLQAAGATVVQAPAEAIALANRALISSARRLPQPVDVAVLQKPVTALNVGLESSYESLQNQGVDVVQVALQPPAGGNEKMMALLSKLKQ